MKMQTLILVGVFLVTLGSALEDAGVFVEQNYGKFEKRVKPTYSMMKCAKAVSYEWHRIYQYERILQDFEGGRNNRNLTFRLWTPAMVVTFVDGDEFTLFGYCKYMTNAFYDLDIYSNATQNLLIGRMPYFAVQVKNTERATVKKGWRYLNNLIKNRFGAIDPENLSRMVIEITAAGVVYVGAYQMNE